MSARQAQTELMIILATTTSQISDITVLHIPKQSTSAWYLDTITEMSVRPLCNGQIPTRLMILIGCPSTDNRRSIEQLSRRTRTVHHNPGCPQSAVTPPSYPTIPNTTTFLLPPFIDLYSTFMPVILYNSWTSHS
ncbi:hypothetical protein ACTXT7_004195 [Hymenolepis weldensis]